MVGKVPREEVDAKIDDLQDLFCRVVQPFLYNIDHACEGNEIPINFEELDEAWGKFIDKACETISDNIIRGDLLP